MFTPGRIAFAIIFAVAFIILMVISYRKDAKNHEAYYKNAAKKVALYGTIAIVLFIGFRYLTSVLF
jgi:cytochrome bd-type quinol oxidase subunit 1